MQLLLSGFTSFALFCSSYALPQGPNTLAPEYPNQRTENVNGTWFILPLPKTVVQSAVSWPLLSPPLSDQTLFPNGFPSDSHPVLCMSAYMNDIRMSVLQIQNLFGGGCTIPYVDRLKDGKSAFQASARQWVGGANGNDLMGVVPAEVGTGEGSTLTTAQFVPNNAAYSSISNNPNTYTFQIKPIIVPNPISGPGVILEGVDSTFTSSDSSPYTPHTFHTVINQPLILNNGLCQRNVYLFNQSFTEPVMRKGNITLYEPPQGEFPKGFGGKYDEVGGYSGDAVLVGFNAEGCASAVAESDLGASER
ncbi:MAG: hypothetical protein Q9227_007473 [Pyrenula ochraceoflavens]